MSLDARVQAILGAPAGQLATLEAGLADEVGNLSFTSRLVPAVTTADLLAAGTHTLLTATLGTGGTAYLADLSQTSFPVLSSSLGLHVLNTTMTIGYHGLTLRLGALLDAAYRAKVLVPAGITAAPDALGTALAASAGCTMISDVACTAASQPTDCLKDACTAMLPVLDAQLGRPFAALTTTGTDFKLSGAAMLVDADHDLVVEGLESGVWSAGVVLDDASTVMLNGSATGTKQ
jgi:hypothetical protein